MAKPPVPYPVVALDLDGTLLTDRLQITPRTVEAVKAARKAGVTFLLASSRSPKSMEGYHRELELETPLVAYNGALIWNAAAGAPLFHQPLATEVARAVVDFVRQEALASNVSLECCNQWYVQEMTDEVHLAIRYFQENPPRGVACLEKVLADASESISKITLRADMDQVTERLASLQPELAQRLQITTTHDRRACEVMAAGVSKAAAVAWAAASIGQPADAILAIGDSPNDIPMLQAAALGVAMGNAAPAVKEAAHVVTASNNEEGVAQAIERYLLGR